MTKKVLFIVTQSEFGGAQYFLAHLTTVLDRKKYDIIVGAGLEGDDEAGLLSFLENKGIDTRHLKYLRRGINPLFDLCLGIIEIYRLIKKEKPDVLFLCSSKAGALGSFAAALIPKSYAPTPKVIYRIGGWTFNDPWPKWKKKIYIWIEKFSARFKDIIINNAKSDTEQAKKLGIKPKKEILTIYNGIDVNKLDFLPKEQARKELNIKFDGLLVGTIANDYPSKGLKYFKKAKYELRDTNCKFIIIGTGNRFIPNAYKYLKAFDIFVLPSVKEGFPWTILEAMAAEIPVIATKVGALPEIIENNKNGILVGPGDPKAIADSIEKLLKDKSLREELAKAGRKTVVEKFNLEKMVGEIEKLF